MSCRTLQRKKIWRRRGIEPFLQEEVERKKGGPEVQRSFISKSDLTINFLFYPTHDPFRTLEQGLSAEQVPVSAYGGSLKNLMDLKVRPSFDAFLKERVGNPGREHRPPVPGGCPAGPDARARLGILPPGRAPGVRPGTTGYNDPFETGVHATKLDSRCPVFARPAGRPAVHFSPVHFLGAVG